jgi:hypothetical protein
MKTSIIRLVALSAICASFVGISASASAGRWVDRDIRAQIAGLRVSKSRALAHGHHRQARAIQAQIDSLKARLHHHWH